MLALLSEQLCVFFCDLSEMQRETPHSCFSEAGIAILTASCQSLNGQCSFQA